MVVGQTIFFLDGNTYYSPTFPRGGLAAAFSVELTHVALSASVTLKVEVEHKNDDDTTWASLGTVATASATGTTSTTLTGIKKQCRFAYSFLGGTPTVTDAAHFIVMAPSWRDYA